MSTTEKLPKWATLLLILAIGMLISFGGQLFIVNAGSANQVKSCRVDNGAPKKGQTSLKDGKGVTIDLSNVHAKCQ
jgi:hypothetical protein